MIFRKVLILGVNRYFLKCLDGLLSKGFDPVCIDKNPHTELYCPKNSFIACDIIDHQKVLELAKSLSVSAIVPTNDYGVKTAAYVSKNLSLTGNSEAAAIAATEKLVMRQLWQKHEVPGPKFLVADSRDGIINAINTIGFPCVLKPGRGIGGASRGVIVVGDKGEIETAIDFSLSFFSDATTLIEECISGDSEHSAEVLIVDGETHVIAIGDKIKTPLPYRVDKSVLYPTSLNDKQTVLAKKYIKLAIEALGVTVGAVHIEFAMTQNGPVFFELGLRPGGGGTADPIVPFVTGIDYFTEYVRLLCGETQINTTPTKNQGCCYQFLTPSSGKLKSITGLEEASKMLGILDAAVLTKPGDQIPTVKSGTDRSGFIIAGAETQRAAHDLALKAEALLKFMVE